MTVHRKEPRVAPGSDAPSNDQGEPQLQNPLERNEAPEETGEGAEGRDVPPPDPRPGGTRGLKSPWMGGG